MTINDDPRHNETEQAAAELNEIAELIANAYDPVTDEETALRWREIRARSNLGIRDGQHRTGSAFRPWQVMSRSWATASAAESSALDALDAMRAATHDHLAALEYQLLAARAELEATEARLELAQVREREAAARALQAEQDAARVKEQAAHDAEAAADALVDAALERSQEITDRARQQADEILTAAQSRAADIVAGAEQHAEQHRKTEQLIASGMTAQGIVLVMQAGAGTERIRRHHSTAIRDISWNAPAPARALRTAMPTNSSADDYRFALPAAFNDHRCQSTRQWLLAYAPKGADWPPLSCRCLLAGVTDVPALVPSGRGSQQWAALLRWVRSAIGSVVAEPLVTAAEAVHTPLAVSLDSVSARMAETAFSASAHLWTIPSAPARPTVEMERQSSAKTCIVDDYGKLAAVTESATVGWTYVVLIPNTVDHAEVTETPRDADTGPGHHHLGLTSSK